MQTGGAFRMAGVMFYPHVMKILFGFNASEVTDDCVDLLLLSGDEGKQLVTQLEDSFDKSALYKLIGNYLSNIILPEKDHPRYHYSKCRDPADAIQWRCKPETITAIPLHYRTHFRAQV